MNNSVTVLSEQATTKGRIITSGSVVINGNFEGNIVAKENITLKQQSKVWSNLKAKNITVGGELNGNINAHSDLIVLATGKIKGKMRSTTIKISKGATTLGKIDINSNLKNDEEKNEDKKK